MNYVILNKFGYSLVLLVAIGASGFVNAHGDEHDEAAPVATQEKGPATHAEQQIPATVEGIWQAIDKNTGELEQMIQGGSLKNVHHLAFAVRDLVAALPERSKALPAEKLAKVTGSVKFVDTLADRLDASGDADDKAATQANYEKLIKVLEGIRANYPSVAAM
jgi:hypothetical protein